jgi:hypothetical protein
MIGQAAEVEVQLAREASILRTIFHLALESRLWIYGMGRRRGIYRLQKELE